MDELKRELKGLVSEIVKETKQAFPDVYRAVRVGDTKVGDADEKQLKQMIANAKAMLK